MLKRGGIHIYTFRIPRGRESLTKNLSKGCFLPMFGFLNAKTSAQPALWNHQLNRSSLGLFLREKKMLCRPKARGEESVQGDSLP